MYESTTHAMAFALLGEETKSTLEMVHTVSEYSARYTIWPHRCIKTKQIKHDKDNFMFSLLLKQRPNRLKAVEVGARDAATN
jgi:hypothetical protein